MTERYQVPFHFGAVGRELFGWYHPARAGTGKIGIVLCNPIGDDSVRAHRTLRHLAALAEAGHPVLRFDFHGTGDSAGDDGDPDRVATWIADVHLAIEALVSRSGRHEICVVGLRLGGTLAAVAASLKQGDRVRGLVLWNPFWSGRAFSSDSVKQRKIQALLDPDGFALKAPSEQMGGHVAGEPPGEEALGFLLTRQTIEKLAEIDLVQLGSRPATRVLVIEPSASPASARAVEHLRALGAETEVQIRTHKFLTMTPHQSTLPTEEMDAILKWVAAEPLERGGPAAASSAEKTSANGREEPVFFGDDRTRFGIFHAAAVDLARPPIVVVNAGTVHRIGPHRAYVRMARAWAKQGYNVFRVDLSGIGDSPEEEGTVENLCYPPRHLADVRAAMDYLQERLSTREFLLVGLCSGADTAFQIGVQDPRVVGAVLMNPRTFCIHPLDEVEKLDHTAHFQSALGKKESWLKLLRGQVDIGWHIRNLGPNLKALVLKKWGRLLPSRAGWTEESVPSRLRRMAERGVDTLLIASVKDPGTDYLDIHFSGEMRALERIAGFRRVNLKGADHTFTALYAQKLVLETISEHLARKYPLP